MSILTSRDPEGFLAEVERLEQRYLDQLAEERRQQ